MSFLSELVTLKKNHLITGPKAAERSGHSEIWPVFGLCSLTSLVDYDTGKALPLFFLSFFPSVHLFFAFPCLALGIQVPVPVIKARVTRWR